MDDRPWMGMEKQESAAEAFPWGRSGKDFATHERMPAEKLQVQSQRLIFNAASSG